MREKQFKFGAIPARAMLDDRLAARHFRFMGTTGLFDQMSGVKGGTCCTASNRKIAAGAGLTEQEASRMKSELVKWGYIEEVPGARGNRPGLRIVYDLAADEAAFTMIVTGQNLVRIDKNTLSAATTNTPENLSEAPQKPQSAQSVIVSKDTSEEKDNLERKDNPEGKRYSDESARIENARSELSFEQWVDQLSQMETTHAQLASFERKWKAHPEWFADNHEAWRSWLFRKYEATIGSDSQRAGRLLEEFYIHEPQPEVGEFLDKLQLDRFARHLNKELYQHGKDPRAPTAREIARHPACIAAGLTEVRISQIRNKKAKVVRMSQWDAFALALTERKEQHA